MVSTTDPAAVYRLQQDLVDRLIRRGVIHSRSVEDAFRAVPRHRFLPGVELARIYRDEVIATKYEGGEAVSSSSQPAMMAIMLEQLDLKPGQRVLEIGAGSGYNAALIAQIVGPTGQVVTVDIDAEMTRHARFCLEQAGFAHVTVITGDGGAGYAPAAPYDRIILTVGAWEVLPAWREQLAPYGRLVLPLSLYGTQKSLALVREGDRLRSVSATDCGFMRMRGPFAGPERWIRLPDHGYIRAEIVDARQDHPLSLANLLHTSRTVRTTTVAASLHDLFGPLWLWLALHGLLPCRFRTAGQEDALIPPLITWPGEHGERVGMGIFTADSLCLIGGDPQRMEHDAPDWNQRFPLQLHSFGSAETLADRIQAVVADWFARSHPEQRHLQLWVSPAGGPCPAQADTFVIAKRWSTIQLHWS